MSEVSSEINTESGLLMRIRSWRDAFPWLAIVDSLRPATSVVVLLMIALATTVALALEQFFVPPQPDPSRSTPTAEISNSAFLGPTQLTIEPATKTLTFSATSIGALRLVVGPTFRMLNNTTTASSKTDSTTTSSKLGPILHALLHQFLLVGVWIIPAGFVIRQSGLAMAGRLLLGTGETLRLIASRALGYLGVVLIPAIIMFATYAYFLLVAAAYRSPLVGPILGGILDVLGIPVAIIGGLIGFGSFIAVPLGWAAVSLERDGSSFDGISRGYEYTLRRPIQWLLYGFIGLIVLCALVLLSAGVATVAETIISSTANLMAPKTIPGRISIIVVSYIPTVVQLTVFWCLLAWFYLLLRRSANNQEIEDVWEQPRPPATPLPELDLRPKV